MALKDWKKINDLKYLTGWENRNFTSKFYFHLVFINDTGKGWAFSTSAEQKYKEFKTKKQALAYAKSYMETH